ncbi:LysR family transcriptional regulator [Marinobacterium jannaschii]|uniref:LysR family transcriptional regulator n=1 Tax=Marinobacterium jannaschii TaxID=64970 RepID=UPI00047F90FB|nr:LysR family transcriptional regulator [Marinobacterium jannaschii]
MLSSQDRFLRNLDWNLLYTFITIVDEGSITGAARKLAYSQPSVSNALKRLEEYLGERLIVRKKGVFSLTDQGLRVYESASSIGSIMGHLADQFAAPTGEISGEINIEIASHIHCPPLDRTLAQYHARYPNVFITTNTQPSADIVSAVADGRLRIGLSNKKVSQTGLRFDGVGYEQMAFYCGRSHPLYGREDLQLDDLRGLAYVSFESDQPGEGLGAIARYRAEQQLWGKLVAVSSNEEEVRRLILAGVGFGALATEAARLFVEAGMLWPLPPYEQLPLTEIYLVTADSVPLTEVEQGFVEMLRKAANDEIRSGRTADTE